MHKIHQFENENEVLSEKLKHFQTQLSTLKKAIKNDQKYLEKLKQIYKMLQKENDLLVTLQSTKKVIEQNEADLSEDETTVKTNYIKQVTNNTTFVNIGLLLLRNLFLIQFL